MGVKGLNTWFTQRYGNCLEVYHQRNLQTALLVDHLYIDLQCIAHESIRKAKTASNFQSILHSKLNQILRTFRPRQSVLLALDGPGPLAKLLKQRKDRLQRYKTISEKGKKVELSQLCLTPGTNFMLDLHRSLQYLIYNKLSKDFPYTLFELSDSTVQGEGEIKVFQRIQRPLCSVGEHDVHVVLGNDSDLMLATLMQIDVQNLCLAINGEDFMNNIGVGSKRRRFSNEEFYIWNIQMLGQMWEVDDIMSRIDFGFLTMMGEGNDYFPSLRGVHVFSAAQNESLWDAYIRLRNQQQQQQLKQQQIQQQQIGIIRIDNGRININTKLLVDVLRESSTEELFSLQSEKSMTKCQAYLQMLIWNVDMYINGMCSNYRMVYNQNSVSASHMLHYLQQLDSADGMIEFEFNNFVPPMKPVECALALLPYNTQKLVPQCLQSLMLEGSPIAELYRVCKVCDNLRKKTGLLQQQIFQRKQQVKKRELPQQLEGLNKNGKRQAEDEQPNVKRRKTCSGVADENKMLEQSQIDTNMNKDQLDEEEGEKEEMDMLDQNEVSVGGQNTEVQRKNGLIQKQGDKVLRELRSQLRNTIIEQERHNEEMHPCSEFPTDKVIQAVADVKNKSDAFKTSSFEEKSLFYFGATQVFVSDQKRRYHSNQLGALLKDKSSMTHFQPPQPPIMSWQKLQDRRIYRQNVKEQYIPLNRRKQLMQHQVPKQQCRQTSRQQTWQQQFFQTQPF